MKKQFKSFKEAKKYVQSLNLNSKKEWDKYCRGGQRPFDIPSNANIVYKEKGWESWGDFLGSGTIYPNNKRFVNYEKAKKFVNTLNLKSTKEWREYCKSGNRPEFIPSSPHLVYRNKGWVSYAYWLGIKKISSTDLLKSKKDESMIFKRLISLKSNVEFKEYLKSRSKNKN